ncbi:MAG: tetratricopeptide repeat protein [Bacteroidota bacterium]|nr:tetratricopeptide repeat protein [Bacteroidota bacterium]
MRFLKLTIRFILLCGFSTLTIGSLAQGTKIEELSRLLSIEKKDSSKVTLLLQLAKQYQSFKPDTSLILSQKALLLAQRIKFIEGESRSLAKLASSQYLLGDYPKALNNYLFQLKIAEKLNSPRTYASALNNIGITYILLEDYPKALEYLYSADSTVDVTGGKTKEELKYNIEVNIGEAYYRMKIPDSASVHFAGALSIARLSGDTAAIGAAILGEANVLSLKNEIPNALSYYHNAYNYLSGETNADLLCEVSLGMAKVYEKLAVNDSAIYYGNMSYSLAEKSKFLSRQLDAALFLRGIYKNLMKYDSAFSYLEQAVQLQDSIKGHEKIKAAMILSINEKLRQQEITEQKIRDKEARYQQLQMLIIAICIPALFLLTLLVSRIKINRRLVIFMGIISLLFLFEFLTLLLHPLIAGFTHHRPIFELLIFVSIAALLVPAHHRLEHVLVNKLTRTNFENNEIRIRTKKMVLKK